VTSQALPVPTLSSPQDVPQQVGCHVILTAPPAANIAKPAGSEKTAPQKEAAPQPGRRNGKAPAISKEQPVEITARECDKAGEVYTLRGEVEIKSGDYIFHGDTVTYDGASGEATTTGNARLEGGPRDMHIAASHANYNVHSQTGKFYDVSGTTGARFRGNNVILTSSNPIAFTAQMLEQTGPQEYVLYHGSVTSCELPHPKWRFHSAKIILRVGDSAKIRHSTFRLKGVPVFYLPYVKTPVEKLGRQSGFLIPTGGPSTGKQGKGNTFGDSFYWAINRTMDATLGGVYYSRRGWGLIDGFRARPSEKAYLNVNYFQVFDRGTVVSGQPQNQGGEDAKLNGETTFAHAVRGVASLEYLSKFVFRQAFTESFAQAVNSEVKSTMFVSKNFGGNSLNGFASRYQNFQSTDPGDVITILHIPALEASGVDQRIFHSPFYVSYDAAGEGLHRSEPNFVTGGLVGRFDIDPNIALPLLFHGWTIRPEAQLRNTLYTQQLIPPAPAPTPIAERDVINRRSIDSSLELLPPPLVKVFDGTFAGRKVKHTIEPRLVYRYTNGVENFGSFIHFDFRDILSNTNEVEYGVVQRLYFKRKSDDCPEAADSPASAALSRAACTPAGADEFLTWELKQKYFFDPNFGGAVTPNQRNVLTTTVDFAGIAFLTEPRRFSPIVSRLRFRTSNATDHPNDLAWELDYDTTKSRINASTLVATFRLRDFFLGASHAFLQVPGEVVIGKDGQPEPPCVLQTINQPTCVPQRFNQVRGLFGYGSAGKRGWSAAANVGYDFEFNLLQYGAAQASYNWDCCGISFEYAHFQLGQVRRENRYLFSFTLANIGSFGTLKRQERLFW
jgi:LPS-assembly protein